MCYLAFYIKIRSVHFDNFVFVLRVKDGYDKPQPLIIKSAPQR